MTLLAGAGLACDEAPEEQRTPEDVGVDPADMGRPDDGVLDPGPADAGSPDAGTPDMGVDCASNPNMCAPMQRLDAQCRCLPECEDDFEWNPVTRMCDPPPAGECATDMDCPGSDGVCLNAPQMGGLAPCAGEATCRCFTSCDPFAEPIRTGCPAGANGQPQPCAHLLTPGLGADAICVPPGMGRVQNEACTQTDPCNRSTNHFCIGLSMTSTVPGVCQRLCDTTAMSGFCADQGPGLACNPANIEDFPDLGLCGNPPVPLTDFGSACANDMQCAGACSQILGGCTARCAPPNACPAGATCINFNGVPPDERSLCMLECPSPDAAGDTMCQQRNPAWVCRAIVTGIPGLCSPPCTVIGCPSAQLMCNPNTGRCE
jgi:hypothetical protein